MLNVKQLFLIPFFVLIAQTSSGQAAVDYLEKITAESKKIQTDMWSYTSAVSHGKSARLVEKRRAELLTTSQQALNRVKNMPAFDGSTTYRDSVISFLTINYLVLKEDYAKIVDMEEIAEKSYDNMEAYLMAQQAANEKMQESADMVAGQQAIFAAQNNITLITNENDELTQKMAVAGVVYEYYNQVYLIFFKSYIQENYLVAAMVAQDMSGLEQNRNALKASTAEGLKLIEAMEAFKGDNSLVEACKNVLKFYQDEAENKIQVITDFHLKNENFNNVQESFAQIKEKDRTQEDVDRYNNAVNEMNEAANAYNTTNDLLNKTRAMQLDAWNKTVAKFTDKHVPKD